MGLASPFVLASDEPRDSTGRGPAAARPRLAAVDATTKRHAAERALLVVVVEDDPAMRMLVQFNLEAAGFRVVLAETGSEGLERIAAEQPDLVLLDVMLPDIGGFDVARRVSGVPIVFMSARASEQDYARGRDAGAIDYVAKPFDPVALAGRLRDDLAELERSGSAAHVWATRFGHTRR